MGARDKEGIIKIWDGSITSTQMGREVLERLRVMPKPAVAIILENQQMDHCPSRYMLCLKTKFQIVQRWII